MNLEKDNTQNAEAQWLPLYRPVTFSANDGAISTITTTTSLAEASLASVV